MRKDTMLYEDFSYSKKKQGYTYPKGFQAILRRIIKKGILVNAIGFLIGRASILGGLTPFGAAFYAAVSGTSINMFVLFLTVNIGILTVGMTLVQLKYIVAITLYSLMNILTPTEDRRPFNNALRLCISVFAVGNAIIFYRGFLLYDFVLNTFESLLVLMFVLLLRNTIIIFENNELEINITSEQIISITVLSLISLIGISNISVLGMSIRNMFIIASVMLFSYKNGASIGAAIGIMAGILISMSSVVSPVIVGVYGFCGLISGALRNVGKLGSIIGFMLANSIITIYANGSTEILINISDIIGAGIIVGFFPKKLINSISNYFLNPSVSAIKHSKIERIKDITTQRLIEFSDSFRELSKTFNKISEKNTRINKEDVATLFEEVAEKICKNCSLNTICWNRDYYSTYQVMFDILEKADSNGFIAKDDVKEYFKEKCIKLDQFVNYFNYLFELYKANVMWQKKMSENRMVVAQQFEGISKIIEQLAEEINIDIAFKAELEKKIQIELAKLEYPVDEVMVVKNKIGRYEVTIAHKPCENQRRCSINIIPIVSNVLEKNFVKDDVLCNVKKDEDLCIIKLIEKCNYKVTTGIACSSKQGVGICGDSYKIIDLKNGKYVLAMSDGMGSGYNASRDSSAVLELLEKFLKSGFDKDLSIKLINSILVLKSAQETFSTIDLSIIDLFSAEVEFAKIGAAATFIKRPDKVEVVKSTSLPVGILKNVDMEISQKDLQEGDIVIMMTDGILDSNNHELNKEEWFKNEIAKINCKSPQEVAEYILNLANNSEDGEKTDDKMVLVAKLAEVV